MGKRRVEVVEAPDSLDAESMAAVRAWMVDHRDERVRSLEPELEEIVETCLDHHRARGNAFACWRAAVRNWIRLEARYRERDGGSPRPGLGRQPGLPLGERQAAEVKSSARSAVSLLRGGRA